MTHNPNETAKIVEKLATEHINLKALCTFIRRLLQFVKYKEKHLSRAWDDIVWYLNLPFRLPFENPQSTYIYPTFSLSVHSVHSSQPSTSCPMPTKLRSDCSNCGKRRSAVRQLLTSNEALKAKLRVLAAVKMQNCYLLQEVNYWKKLRSKLRSVKEEMMASNAMVKKLTEENVLLRNESSPAEVR